MTRLQNTMVLEIEVLFVVLLLSVGVGLIIAMFQDRF